VWSHMIHRYSDPNYQRIQHICPHVQQKIGKRPSMHGTSCILRHKTKLLSRYCKYSFNLTQCKAYTHTHTQNKRKISLGSNVFDRELKWRGHIIMWEEHALLIDRKCIILNTENNPIFKMHSYIALIIFL